MAGYKGFRNKRWNKSGCDPYNNGIPEKLYGCGEEWRYDLCKLTKPNVTGYRIADFGRAIVYIESPRCKIDKYELHIWDELSGIVVVHHFDGSGASEHIVDNLLGGHNYNFYVVGFRDKDSAFTTHSEIKNLIVPKTGAYNRKIDNLCIDGTAGHVYCSDYIEF